MAMLLTAKNPEQSTAYRTGALVLFAAVVVIMTALAFEHFGGYLPCPLCLQQRYAYYAGIPALFLALVLLSAGYARGAAAVFLRVVRCDKAPWQFLGLSFAGWNVVASGLLTIGSLSAAAKAWRS